MSLFRKLVLSTVVLSGVGVLSVVGAGSPRDASCERDTQIAFEPLTDVHGLMEYVVEGNFKNLKAAIEEPPADNTAWRRVYSLSTLVAESGNLLLMRKPEDADAKEWTALAVGLRKSGGELMKAAKAKDVSASRRSYVVLVESCNQCHAKYGDDGEPKVKP